MTEGRYAAALGLRAVYQSVFFAEIGGIWLRHDTPFDGIRDRSSYSIALGARF